jgi:hypothetical protein
VAKFVFDATKPEKYVKSEPATNGSDGDDRGAVIGGGGVFTPLAFALRVGPTSSTCDIKAMIKKALLISFSPSLWAFRHMAKKDKKVLMLRKGANGGFGISSSPRVIYGKLRPGITRQMKD